MMMSLFLMFAVGFWYGGHLAAKSKEDRLNGELEAVRSLVWLFNIERQLQALLSIVATAIGEFCATALSRPGTAETVGTRW